mmetsp:Transcript_13199/g.25967  ORF Transcript_13199/g.25967 Transcript_13199/m.25967 type:complete len:398 (+) Transcript_13199:41-1234(+)
MASKDEMELDTEEVEEKIERTFPNMDLAQSVWKLECEGVDIEAVKETVLTAIKEDKMVPFYEIVCQKFGWMVDDALLTEMKTANAAELESLQAALKNNEENEGETEVLDSLFAISKFHARIGAKTETYDANEAIIVLPKVTSGKKIDATMAKARMALFYMDQEVAAAQIEAAKHLAKDGGDWDRRNRLKCYEAILLMMQRDFKTAAALLLDGIATFTCVELCSYETFVYYAVSTNMLFLDRPSMKKKLVDGPEVLGLIGGLPPLAPMLNGLYDCEYAAFFACLGDMNDTLLLDRYLAKHARYLVREFRILVYKQFLESYKSVMVGTMAQAFGVSSGFLDSELSRFIASGRLSAKIDKVGGKVETNPPDERNSQYQTVIKKGDFLLTSIQKLARVIDA